MDSKRCFKCDQLLPLSEFYRHSKMRDGRLGKCKNCTRRDVTLHRRKNIEKIRAYDRRRGARATPEYQREYRRRNPEKIKAQRKVAYEVRMGRLTAKPCEVCGELSAHAHHDDYARWLDVRWLCALHHREHHEKEKR